MSGWISLHRDIRNHWLYPEDRAFTEYEAWIDLIMMVNHEPKKVMIDSDLVEVGKGQRITSIRKLGRRWGWSRTKVDSFLKLLESEKMVVLEKDSKKTLITLVNYEVYQNDDIEKRHRKDAEKTQKNTNNNDNNENKDIPFFEIVDYLNKKTGRSYRHTTQKTKSFIRARWNDGFQLDDFKQVIDTKVSEWQDDPKMSKYLRPETLFGTKFESYLNQPTFSDPIDFEERRLQKERENTDRKIALQRWVEAGNDPNDFVYRGLGS